MSILYSILYARRKFDQIYPKNKELITMLNKNAKIMTKKLATFTSKIVKVKATPDKMEKSLFCGRHLAAYNTL